MNEISNHPTFMNTQEIKQICAPLEYLDITAFSHLRVFNDGKLTVLCNHPAFLLNYLKKKYYHADPCVQINPVVTDIGQYLVWDVIDC